MKRSLVCVFILSALAGCYGAETPTNPQSVVSHLVVLLEDRDPDVRRSAALSLGKIADPEAIAPLLKGLSDPDPLVRRHSAWALGNIGEPALKPAAMALAEALGDPSEEVNRAAAEALGRIADSGGATQSLVELLLDGLRERDVQQRRAAVAALGQIEARSAYLGLVDALRDEDPRVRQGAVAALGELAEPRALPVLTVRLAQDPDPGVRTEAAFRLGKFGDATTVAPLKAASDSDPDQGVRRWATWAVQSIAGDAPAMGNGH